MKIHRFCTSNAEGELIFKPLDIKIQFNVPPLVLPEFKNKDHHMVIGHFLVFLYLCFTTRLRAKHLL